MAQAKKAAADPAETAKKAETIKTLEALGAAQCPLDEVAFIMDRVGHKRPFSNAELKAYKKGRAQGLKDLRLAQLDMAKKSVPMATMLGRLYLGQSEQREQDESAPIDYAGIKERIRDKLAVLALSETAETD